MVLALGVKVNLLLVCLLVGLGAIGPETLIYRETVLYVEGAVSVPEIEH